MTIKTLIPVKWTRWIAFCCAGASLIAFAAGHPLKAVTFAAAAAYFGVATVRAGRGGH